MRLRCLCTVILFSLLQDVDGRATSVNKPRADPTLQNLTLSPNGVTTPPGLMLSPGSLLTPPGLTGDANLPASKMGNEISWDDVSVAVAVSHSSEAPLPPEDTTRLLFSAMVEFYRTAAKSGGDILVPKQYIRKEWDDLSVTVLPALNQNMRHSDIFFALGWIWSFMAVPVPQFNSPHRGYNERSYVVYRNGLHSPVGFVKVGFKRTAQAGRIELEQLRNTTSTEPAGTVETVDSTSITDPASPTTNLTYPYPPVWPVMDSMVVLYFVSPRTKLPSGSPNVVIYLLLSAFHEAWSAMVRHGGNSPFSPTSRTYNELRLALTFEPKVVGAFRQSMMTPLMVADSVWGIVFYMLHEGFFGARIGMHYTTQSKSRISLGDILIIFPAGRLGGDANDTAPAVATS